MKEVFIKIREALENSGLFPTVKLFNNQFRFIEDRTELGIVYPAVFIQFLPMDYVDRAKGVQSANGTIRLHLAEFELDVPDESRLELREQLHKIVGSIPADECTSTMTRTREEMDPDYTALQAFLIDYSVEFWDAGTFEPDNYIDSRPVDLNIHRD